MQRSNVALGHWLHRYTPARVPLAGWDIGAIPYYSRVRVAYDMHSTGLLDPVTGHEGYDERRFYARRPDFVVLPARAGPAGTSGIRGFYSQPGFRRDYDSLFTVQLTRDCRLVLFKRRGIHLPELALAAAARFTQLTVDSAGLGRLPSGSLSVSPGPQRARDG